MDGDFSQAAVLTIPFYSYGTVSSPRRGPQDDYVAHSELWFGKLRAAVIEDLKGGVGAR